MRNESLRNVAIIAHVDHGKTTLVDRMIAWTGLVRENQDLGDCVLDSNALERERGITILAKNISVTYRGVKINVIDTPGHADFGGEVERVLRMADGVLLLVDAAEGPLPQTRFVLRKALALHLPAIVVINKVDRSDARPHEVLDEVFELFLSLGADDRHLDFAVLYASGRQGFARYQLEDGHNGMEPLFETILSRIPAPEVRPDDPLRMLVTNIDFSEYTGRGAVGRVFAGRIEENRPLAVVKRDGRVTTCVPKRVVTFEGLRREPRAVVEAGEICLVEGLESVDIGDTLADPANPVAMPGLAVDDPTLSMLFTVNASPFAGTEGKFVTSRHLRERLERELESNVALRVEDTDRPETLKVSGRGILHLGVLIENMRREGYEFAVGKPRVILREEGGRRLEPVETLVVDAPADTSGRVIENASKRRGELRIMESRGDRVHMEFEIPSRGLIGLRTRVLNLTGGQAVMHHNLLEYQEWKGALPERTRGVMVSSETGEGVTYALHGLRDRGPFFIHPGERVYGGMIVGEHCKDNDIDVNVCRTKKLTNIRAAGADEKLILPPPRIFTVEEALEYIDEDELVEFTPRSVRLRKIHLDPKARRRRKDPAEAGTL